MTSPIRPVSEEHRHEPADYEVGRATYPSREELARIVDPFAFIAAKSMLDSCLIQGEDNDITFRCVVGGYGDRLQLAYERADAVLSRFPPQEPSPLDDGVRERVARIVLSHVTGNDPDELIHHPWQKSWEAPTQKRWEQFAEAADAILSVTEQPGEVERLREALRHALKWIERLVTAQGTTVEDLDGLAELRALLSATEGGASRDHDPAIGSAMEEGEGDYDAECLTNYALICEAKGLLVEASGIRDILKRRFSSATERGDDDQPTDIEAAVFRWLEKRDILTRHDYPVTAGDVETMLDEYEADFQSEVDRLMGPLSSATGSEPASTGTNPETPSLKARVERLEGALADIAAERQRQIEVEGWTPEHDDDHSDGALADAAACYAVSSCVSDLRGAEGTRFINIWPAAWSFKPRGRRRDLVRAGALIVAEIERRDRAALQGSDAPAVAPAPEGRVEFGNPWNVEKLGRYLLSLNEEERARQVKGAYHVEIHGKMVCRAQGLSISWETIDGNTIGKFDDSDRTMVFWTHPAEPDAPAVDGGGE